MIDYEHTLDLCNKFKIEIEERDGQYKPTNKNLASYINAAIEKYGARLFKHFNKLDLIVPCWSELLQEYFIFDQDENGDIIKLEFSSGVIYEGDLLKQFRAFPKEDKIKIHMIRNEFK